MPPGTRETPICQAQPARIPTRDDVSLAVREIADQLSDMTVRTAAVLGFPTDGCTASNIAMVWGRVRTQGDSEAVDPGAFGVSVVRGCLRGLLRGCALCGVWGAGWAAIRWALRGSGWDFVGLGADGFLPMGAA